MQFGGQSPADAADGKYIGNDFSVGPPYVATKTDFLRISESWSKFTPKVHEEFAQLLTEMYGYSLAAAHHRLPHTVINNMMVSDVLMNKAEGWPEIDALSTGGHKCVSDLMTHPQFSNLNTPFVLHYCHPYTTFGGNMWSKHRIPHNIFTCERQLLKMPVANAMEATTTQVKATKTAHGKVKDKQVYQRESFMLCMLYHSLNAALRSFKAANCAKQGKVEHCA